MKAPPLLAERSRPMQILLAVVAPIALGAVAGILIGVSAGLYLLLSLLAAVGALAAGFEHLGAQGGARRGALAGFLYGAALLITHELEGSEELVDLSDPAAVLVVLTIAFGALFAAIGGSFRARRELGDQTTLDRS